MSRYLLDDCFLHDKYRLTHDEVLSILRERLACVAAREDVALPADCVVFGEISLSGALRPVAQSENRLKEAAKLGFTSAMLPRGGKPGPGSGVRLREMADLTGFVGEVFGAG